jgi:hypothetical protein
VDISFYQKGKQIKNTNMVKNEQRSLLLEKARKHHTQLIKDLGIDSKDFQIKRALTYNGQVVVPFYEKEFQTEKGLYFELANSSYTDFENADRRVYRLPTNINPEEEAVRDPQYYTEEKKSYFIALEELNTVNPTSVAISKSAAALSSDEVLKSMKTSSFDSKLFKMKPADAPSSIEDAPYSDLTIRDYIAIHTGKLVSNKKWLNDLIKQIQ